MIEYKYKKRENKFTENGHTMFETDVLQRLKRLADLEEQIKQKKLLPIQRVSGSTLHPVGKLPEGSEDDVCHLCRYKHECSDEDGVYERCLSELKRGEYYR